MQNAFTARLLLFTLLVGGFAAAASAQEPAAPYVAGDSLVPFTLDDQHGEPSSVDEKTRVVLFAADMDGGDLVGSALESDPSLQDLEQFGAVFVSDIHRMPALVTRLFALPSMRRRPYRMLLDREPGPTVRLPRQEGHVTVMRLDGLTVESVAYVADAEGIAVALRPEAEPTP